MLLFVDIRRKREHYMLGLHNALLQQTRKETRNL